tara:strand:- start:180 stop:461 length:282 start_codon:yes stop_codon:yes gene_type:complete
MYLVPLIRSSRALTSTLLYSENPLLAITLSETLSVVIPYINFELKHPMLVFRLISSYDNFMYMMYLEDKEKYYKIELFCLLVLMLSIVKVNYI